MPPAELRARSRTARQERPVFSSASSNLKCGFRAVVSKFILPAHSRGFFGLPAVFRDKFLAPENQPGSDALNSNIPDPEKHSTPSSITTDFTAGQRAEQGEVRDLKRVDRPRCPDRAGDTRRGAAQAIERSAQR
jgi:hypothetical protein